MNLERKFSKELAGDLRKETADKLREARKKPITFSELNKEMKCKKQLPEEYDTWAGTKENFEELRKNIFGKIFKTEKFRKQEFLLNQYLESKKESDIKEVWREYNKKLNDILTNCPLTPEEREKNLSTEAMEQMSLEDYLTLTDRLSGEAFYHVKRYGVRENTFMSTGGGHTQGEGSFVDGFTPLLKDGNINSATSTIIKDPSKAKSMVDKETIENFKKEGKSIDEVVDKIMGSYGTQYFLDRESTHFSYGKELHNMYGGEKDYKFYFYYPVEYILQNDFYQSTREGQITIGSGYYLNKGGIDQQYNDFEIFNFGKGVPINAGILCIGTDIRVDPETGSQYLIQNGKPEVDENGKFKKPEKTISSQEYWENYFELHPEIKPSKIMYGNFYTSNYDENNDLKNFAESKEIGNQDESRKAEFLDYSKSSRKILREIFTDVVQEVYSSAE